MDKKNIFLSLTDVEHATMASAVNNDADKCIYGTAVTIGLFRRGDSVKKIYDIPDALRVNGDGIPIIDKSLRVDVNNWYETQVTNFINMKLVTTGQKTLLSGGDVTQSRVMIESITDDRDDLKELMDTSPSVKATMNTVALKANMIPDILDYIKRAIDVESDPVVTTFSIPIMVKAIDGSSPYHDNETLENGGSVIVNVKDGGIDLMSKYGLDKKFKGVIVLIYNDVKYILDSKKAVTDGATKMWYMRVMLDHELWSNGKVKYF